MACYHGEHQDEAAACTRTRSSNIAGAATALHLLKRWAQLGAACHCKQAHKRVWGEVEREARSGTLPAVAELDAWARATHLR